MWFSDYIYIQFLHILEKTNNLNETSYGSVYIERAIVQTELAIVQTGYNSDRTRNSSSRTSYSSI